MIFWRCQKNPASDGFDFNWTTNGAAGSGVYAMLKGANNLKKYYSQLGEDTYEFEIEDKYIVEVKGAGLSTYWAIRERIYVLQEEGFKAFILKHKGINIPTGKQVLITDVSIIKNLKKI